MQRQPGTPPTSTACPFEMPGCSIDEVRSRRRPVQRHVRGGFQDAAEARPRSAAGVARPWSIPVMVDCEGRTARPCGHRAGACSPAVRVGSAPCLPSGPRRVESIEPMTQKSTTQKIMTQETATQEGMTQEGMTQETKLCGRTTRRPMTRMHKTQRARCRGRLAARAHGANTPEAGAHDAV